MDIIPINNGKSDFPSITQGSDEHNDCAELELSDIFYTSQKKGHVFQVKLNTKGFTLQRESLTGGTKEQLVSMCDIVGSRCMRLQKIRRLGGVCACTSLTSSSSPPPASISPKSMTDIPTRRASATAGLMRHSNKSPTISSIQRHSRVNEDGHDDEADGDVSAYLYVFAYVLKKNLRSALRRERTVLTLRFRSFDTFEENMQEAERWYKALRWHKNCTLLDDYGGHFASTSLSSGMVRGSHAPPPPVYNMQCQAVATDAHGYQQRRLLILLNPKSGSGKARELFHQHVAPVLNEAELPYDLYVTKHANYAREFVRLRSLSLWTGIVSVGGDGLFFEILNGLLQRHDWEPLIRRISLGVVPCGSGNGLARSIAYSYNEPYDPKPILGAALTIISGRMTPIDVVRIEIRNQIIYSFLSVGWGLISDIDIESERLRSLGYQRFAVWTLHRLISLRSYRGKVSYLLKHSDASGCNGSPFADRQRLGTSASTRTTLRHSQSYNTYLNKPEYGHYFKSAECISSDVDFNDVISLETSINQSFRSRCDSWFSAGSRKSTYYSIADSVYHSVAAESEIGESNNLFTCQSYGSSNGGGIGPRTLDIDLSDPVSDAWTVEDGEFIMVHAAYQTHLGIDCFFAPSAKLNDGTIHLVIIRSGISRSQLLSFLLNMSSGTHLPSKNNEFVKVVAVSAFRIEPQAQDGIITVDGERVEFGALQAEMLPGLARVMVPK